MGAFVPMPKCFQSHKATSSFYRASPELFGSHFVERCFPGEQKNNSVRSVAYQKRQFHQPEVKVLEGVLAHGAPRHFSTTEQLRLRRRAGAEMETIHKDV